MRETDHIGRRLTAVGLIAIGVYFFRLTRPALRAGFSPDDCMNLYRAWFFPLRDLFKANVLFFLPSDFIRPMGEAWYRAIYYFAGFHAAPFHAVAMLLLLANIVLAYFLARHITQSRFAGLVAALLFAYQPRWAAVYFDTGYIFDVLCAFFFFAALLVWLREGPLWAVIALFICALNSKEIAVVFPVVALATRPRRAALLFPLSIAFVIGRTGALTSNPAYAPQFTLSRLLETTAHFANELFSLNNFFTGPSAILAVSLAIALAVFLGPLGAGPRRLPAFRRAAGAQSAFTNPLLFACLFTVATALPLAFVPPRGGPQYYIPLFGCALYAAALLQVAAQRLHLGLWPSRFAAAAVLSAIAWPSYAHGKYVALGGVSSITDESPIVTSLSARLRQFHPTLPRHARLLFLHDPIQPNLEDLLFIVCLTYRDRTLQIDRLSRMDWKPSLRQMQAYDAVFDYAAPLGLTQLSLPPLDLHPRILQFFDSDWQAIGPAHPATPGARIIVLAQDLGPTRPDPAPGQPFPRDPLAQILARLEVTVDGVPSAVTTAIGQPGELNTYRFDFTLVPPVVLQPVRSGVRSAQIKISAAGCSSPAAEMEVKR